MYMYICHHLYFSATFLFDNTEDMQNYRPPLKANYDFNSRNVINVTCV